MITDTIFYQCAIHEILTSFPKDGVKFERLTKALFEAQGFRVQTTPRSGDRGIDLYMEKDRIRYIVQCKMYQRGSNVGGPEIQRLLGALHSNTDVSHAFFVTTSDFTPQAREMAEKQRITLINGDVLQRWIYRYFPPAPSPTAAPLLPHVPHLPLPSVIKKRRWTRTQVAIGLGLLATCCLVWGVLCTLASSPSEQQQAVVPSQGQPVEPIASALAVPATSTSVPLPTATPTLLPGPGQAVPVGTFAFMVREVMTTTQVDKYHAEGVFLVVSLWVENMAMETKGIGPMDARFQVSDERGRTWEEHKASASICWQRGQTYIGSASLIVTQERPIGPGFGFETSVAFDVPVDAQGFMITVTDNPSKMQGMIALDR